jgi:hypothetical protein
VGRNFHAVNAVAMDENRPKPGDIARRLVEKTRQQMMDRARAATYGPDLLTLTDGFLRETFSAPRDEAREIAREWLERYPKAAYMTAVERWSELPDGRISFTLRRLKSAD